MTENRNLKEHNEERIKLISSKLDAAENSIEKEIVVLESGVDSFLNTNVKGVLDELLLLNVDNNLPISNLKKTNFDKILKKDNFEEFLENDNFNLSAIKVKGSMFKNFICSLFTGFAISGSIYLYKLFDLGLLKTDNLMSSFTVESLTAVMTNIASVIPDSPIAGNVILGTLAGIIFIFLFVIKEKMRKGRVKKAQNSIKNEIDSYEKYVSDKLSSYKEVSIFLKRLLNQIEALSILLDEEKAKLRRINFMKGEDDKMDLKTVKDISRIVKLIETTTDLLALDILNDNELSMEANEALQDSEEYIEKHIKKIYNKED